MINTFHLNVRFSFYPPTFQQCFRAKLQRKKYLKDREDIIKTQRAVRSWLHHRNQAASVIQHAVRKLLFRRRKERLQRGLIRAQVWRKQKTKQKKPRLYIEGIYSKAHIKATIL